MSAILSVRRPIVSIAVAFGLAMLALSVVGANAPVARTGRVRAQGRSVADAGGQFNALGATLFWGAWGYKFDRPRLERNLEALNTAGVDYIRVLGAVGGESWEDRQTDPRWPDYDAVIAGMTDLAYDRYGIRVQWTLFGGPPYTATASARESLVDRFAAMARGREHKIFALEIANEGWKNGFEGSKGIAELRRLGKRLSDRTPVLVALSAPGGNALCETYAASGVDTMTIHYPRRFGNLGPTEPLLRPWTASVHSAACRDQLPPLVLNNEPIGPESSVNQDDSPSRIAAAYIMTFLAGNAAYVLHAGPGVRGGGAADLALTPPRHAEFTELPSFKPIAAALSSAHRYLPRGLPNWTRHAPNAAGVPLHGFDGLYTAASGSRFVALAVGVEKGSAVRSRVGAAITIRDAATGDVVTRLTVTPGTNIPLAGAEELVIIGRGT
jgi:hypothetical protein